VANQTNSQPRLDYAHHVPYSSARACRTCNVGGGIVSPCWSLGASWRFRQHRKSATRRGSCPHATDRVGDPHLPGGRSKRSIPGRPCFVSVLAPSGPTPGARETVRRWHQSTSTTSLWWPASRQAPPKLQEVAEPAQKHQKLTGSGAVAPWTSVNPGPLADQGAPKQGLGAIHRDVHICGWQRLPPSQRCYADSPQIPLYWQLSRA
jgi:hypothetical protein